MAALCCMVGSAQNSSAQGAKTPMEKVILDTDIGDDIDDAYALALLMSMPNVRVLGVTTAWGQTQERAELAVKLLHVMGHDKVPVYAGRRGDARIGRQYEWAKRNGGENAAYTGKNAVPAVQKDDAVTFLKREFDKAPGEVTLIAIGPLVNVGDLVTRYPEVKSKIKRIVIMGGAVHLGYNNQSPPVVEWNIKCDPVAARAVYESGVPLTMAGLEATTMLKFDMERQKRLFAQGSPMTDAIAALTILWGNGTPTLFDPMAVAWAGGAKYCETEERHVVVESDGMTRITDGTPNVTVLINPQKDAFLDWYVTALAGHTTSK
jgi:purine nucleosidase